MRPVCPLIWCATEIGSAISVSDWFIYIVVVPIDSPHRKQMHRREIPGRTRFITFSCQRRLTLLKQPAICRIFLESLERARARSGASIYAWVIMPEHVHLLMMPGDIPLDRTLLSIKLTVSKRVILRWQDLNAPVLNTIRTSSGCPCFWQKGGGHDRNIRDLPEFRRKVQYIHRNPVERGLVEHPPDWRWSSVRWWMGFAMESSRAIPHPDIPGCGMDGLDSCELDAPLHARLVREHTCHRDRPCDLGVRRRQTPTS